MNGESKNEMRVEYDFRGKKGVRGKYYKALQKGYKTIIHKSDGSTVVKETRPIFLDEDVQAYFPDSKSVNSALRNLIEQEKIGFSDLPNALNMLNRFSQLFVNKDRDAISRLAGEIQGSINDLYLKEPNNPTFEQRDLLTAQIL